MRVGSLIGFRIFGQVINRVANISDFGHKEGKGFGKRAAHPHPFFSGSTPGGRSLHMRQVAHQAGA